MSREEQRIIEALLFTSPDVLTQARIDLVFDGDSPRLDTVVSELNARYEREDHSFAIEKVAGGYRLVTRPEFEPWIQRMRTRASASSISRAALEALSVVAYKGPVSRAEIESIRGVDSGSVIKTLLEKDLIGIKGRAKGPGRPLIYVVTPTFLVTFGIDSLSDLPKLREISDLVSAAPGGRGDSPGSPPDPPG
ncbi:MAG: SMC-Scp complex subunit ScpB [Fidelibacterota bacterium]